MGLLIEKRVALLFFGLLLLTTIGHTISYRMVTARGLTEQDTARLRTIAEELRFALGTIRTAETGQRGYIITGDESYLQPYYASREYFPQQMQKLRTVITDPARQTELDELEKLAQERFESLRVTVDTRRELGFDAAAKRIASNKGKMLMDDIARHVDRMQSSIHDERARAAAAFDHHRRVGAYIDGALTAMSVLLLVSGLIFMSSYATRRRSAEDGLSRVVGELDRARADADRANQAKSLFLANMSHELRTPLTSIIGFAEMIGEDAESRHDAQTASDARQVLQSARQLLVLINDVLDLSKIEAGRITTDMEEFSLQHFIDEVVGSSRPLVQRNSNRFIIDLPEDPGWVETDASKLRQIVTNLLSNAAKFTSEGTVTLRLRQVGDQLTITISDTGIGMSEEVQARLFQPFTQADAQTSRRFGGTGLGLAISRNLARHLGGDITVRSAPGEGSVFTLTLEAKNIPQPLRATTVV